MWSFVFNNPQFIQHDPVREARPRLRTNVLLIDTLQIYPFVTCHEFYRHIRPIGNAKQRLELNPVPRWFLAIQQRQI